MDNLLEGKKHIHFIGIGGSGMYPLAQILNTKGYFLTGSDNNETETLAAVRKMGIPVTLGQRAENITGADLVIYSAAIMEDNPELVAARESGVLTVERSILLGYISKLYKNAVCVAGTHGKTTTTSLLTSIFITAGVDISAVIGGKLPLIQGSGKVGNSDTLVLEACEFNDTFLQLSPDTSIILNIDDDHLDYFGTIENSIASFSKFIAMSSHKIFYNGDDRNTVIAVDKADKRAMLGKKIITFGLNGTNNYYSYKLNLVNGKYNFKVVKDMHMLGEITLNIPGKHNIYNALAAIAVAEDYGIGFQFIKEGIENFTGAGRRFEILGKYNDATIVDDYAHHPAEIAATLTSAKEMGFNRIWAIFQPFTFSRTSMLLNEFVSALKIADKVVLTDIMGSREKNTYNIYTRHLAEKICGSVYFPQDENAEYTDERKEQNFNEIAAYIKENALPGDLVITLGCGDVYKIAGKILS